jgi:hypothetical protein
MEQNMNNAPAPPDQPLRDIEAQIENWFVETIHNSPVSRATEIFNHVRASVDALKQRLAALMQEL